MDFLGHKESKLIAGVAILLMMFHHIFGFPEYRINGNDYIVSFSIYGISFERMIAAFGKICVALFAFSSGYVIWKKSGDYLSLRVTFNRVIRFLINYWIIFALFIFYGLCVGDSLPSGRNFWYNLVGLETAPQKQYVNVVFAWYVATYVVLVFLSPILINIFRGKIFVVDIVLYICFILGLSLIYNSLWGYILSPVLYAICGLLVAKWNLFNRILPRTDKLSIWIFVLVIVVLALFRQSLILLDVNIVGVDGIFAAIFIFAVINIFNRLRCEWLNKIIIFLGFYSMNLWYLHGIFFTGSRPLQDVLYYPKYPILIFILCIAIVLPIAMGCDFIQRKFYSGFSALCCKILKRK
ncbi:acyltransferase family protein [Barnesiella viscericola]|uniref:acyltransferase family protein n=1 Tax=Barnesiella viscericola TaxID=397865 RepID=UPI0025A48593|nr:acyltransferase family protein [Barnesiella viscericola]MDM8268298.1 acyltransferase family protein [Barnesiella viscericola]